MREHLALEVDEFRTGLDAEFGDENLSRLGERGQRIGGLSAPVASDNEQGPKRFVKRIRRDELFQRRERIAVSTLIEERRRPQLLRENMKAQPPTRWLVGPILARKLDEWDVPPERKCFIQQGDSAIAIVERGSGRNRSFEARRVERIGVEVEDVAAVAMLQPDTIGPEELS
jgi:hypothetical protein